MKKINYVKNKIFNGVVRHTRYFPFSHTFTYKISYFWFSVNNFENFFFFKRNKLSIFSFFDNDHGEIENKGSIEDFIKKKLKKVNIKFSEIKIFCLPKIFGYNFNPISIFILFDVQNIPSGIIFEVNNTFKERHLYFSKIIKNQTNFNFDKEFYVSPFFEVKGKYNVNFEINDKKILLDVKYLIDKKKVFEASFFGKSEDMNETNLLRRFFSISSQNIKVTSGIYIQALKLFFKGAKYINRPRILKTKFKIINERRQRF